MGLGRGRGCRELAEHDSIRRREVNATGARPLRRQRGLVRARRARYGGRMLPIILPADPDRHARLGRLYRRAEATPAEVEASARRIVDDVRARGDAAVREHTERLERRTLGALEIEPAARE